MIYALDTNVIVHLLHKKPNVRPNFDNALLHGQKIIVPKMVDYEIRRGFFVKFNQRKEEAYKILLEDCIVVDIDTDTWKHAIPIYVGHYLRRHTVDEMDILIAALCIQNNYTLVTNNAKDFQSVVGLNWVDWTQSQP